ncbi:corticotropin-releasing factor-binding protein-like [Asterias rubens]|uniref:corticotropin-releasing factor-binding protein-like n=1 Tax=Asterias rubens TaxID=7604 RepID=UPI001455894D|nr:corticotropin-releasing factor-binding protein-like [Asterias rubens]
MSRSGVVCVLTIAVLCIAEIVNAAPAPERYFGFDQSAMRVFRRGGQSVKSTSASSAKELECPYDVITQPGEYYIRAAEAHACTWLFISGANSVVELELVEVELPCVDNSFIEFFDGVALQMGVFPTEADHELTSQERVNLPCKTGNRVLVSSQNVAMLTYQFPASGAAFRLLFKHKSIQDPCNIFIAETSGAFTLSNYGRERNCSFAGIFPGYINVMHMAVGRETNEARLKCKDFNDMAMFLEGNSFEFSKMNIEQRMCGRTGTSTFARNTTPELVAPSVGEAHGRDAAISSLVYKNRAQCTSGINIPLMCQFSMVRLVSSGLYENSLTFIFTREAKEINECSVY